MKVDEDGSAITFAYEFNMGNSRGAGFISEGPSNNLYVSLNSDWIDQSNLFEKGILYVFPTDSTTPMDDVCYGLNWLSKDNASIADSTLFTQGDPHLGLGREESPGSEIPFEDLSEGVTATDISVD